MDFNRWIYCFNRTANLSTAHHNHLLDFEKAFSPHKYFHMTETSFTFFFDNNIAWPTFTVLNAKLCYFRNLGDDQWNMDLSFRAVHWRTFDWSFRFLINTKSCHLGSEMVNSELFRDSLLVVSSFLLAFGTVAKHEAENRVSIPLGKCLSLLLVKSESQYCWLSLSFKVSFSLRSGVAFSWTLPICWTDSCSAQRTDLSSSIISTWSSPTAWISPISSYISISNLLWRASHDLNLPL